ncbi:MAG: transcription antitermination factor NusB [Deltaproteobacteria bacterium]|nr:transcription antitermination factor NusB [Deltaproteobacteria bacterium]
MRLRKKAREAALKALYQLDVTDSGVDDCVTNVASEMKLTIESLEYAKTLVGGVRNDLKGIDALISEHSKNWDTSRMPVIDRNVIRLAVYEITKSADVPFKVAIDEAVELAKKYGSAESGPFVNGVLDAIVKSGVTVR